jgi:hypothetical protein
MRALFEKCASSGGRCSVIVDHAVRQGEDKDGKVSGR